MRWPPTFPPGARISSLTRKIMFYCIHFSFQFPHEMWNFLRHFQNFQIHGKKTQKNSSIKGLQNIRLHFKLNHILKLWFRTSSLWKILPHHLKTLWIQNTFKMKYFSVTSFFMVLAMLAFNLDPSKAAKISFGVSWSKSF